MFFYSHVCHDSIFSEHNSLEETNRYRIQNAGILEYLVLNKLRCREGLYGFSRYTREERALLLFWKTTRWKVTRVCAVANFWCRPHLSQTTIRFSGHGRRSGYPARYPQILFVRLLWSADRINFYLLSLSFSSPSPSSPHGSSDSIRPLKSTRSSESAGGATWEPLFRGSTIRRLL